jgi:hypothetical protein
MRTPLHVGFWEKVRKADGDGCWEWMGCRTSFGHGQLGRYRPGGGQDVFYAHRVSYEFAHGPIPAGLCVLHNCDNPPCVNPAHLRLGTQAENVRDMKDKFRSGTQKLSREQVAEMISMVVAGVRRGDVATKFGVSTMTVGRYVRRRAA